MPDPLTDADLRARADQVNAWLVSLENGPLDLHRVLDAQELMRDLLAVVDQWQTLLAKLEYMEPEKFAAWRARAETLRAEAAEARLQALQPYLKHKADCDFVQILYTLDGLAVQAWPGALPCSCGFATLPQPGTASREKP